MVKATLAPLQITRQMHSEGMDMESVCGDSLQHVLSSVPWEVLILISIDCQFDIT